MVKEKAKQKKEMSKNLAGALKKEEKISTRGRTFEGFVVKKFPNRATIEFGRTVYIPKYERFLKKKTRIHVRLPNSLAGEVHVGDLIKIQECRPLSKMIHHVVIGVIRKSEEKKQ